MGPSVSAEEVSVTPTTPAIETVAPAVETPETPAVTSEAVTSEAVTSEAVTSEAVTSEAVTSEAATSEAVTSEAVTSEATTPTATSEAVASEASASETTDPSVTTTTTTPAYPSKTPQPVYTKTGTTITVQNPDIHIDFAKGHGIYATNTFVFHAQFEDNFAINDGDQSSFTLPLHFNGDIDHNLINYRSVLLTNDKELLSTPVTATAATGNIVYNYVNKKTNTVIKSVNGGKHFTETPQTHTFKNEVIANGKTYKRVSDKEPNTVTIVTKQGTTTITRYYESANPTTVTIKYVFDDTDENTNLFLAGQLPSGNEHTGDFNLGIAPTHTEIDAESSKTFNGNNKPRIDITPDIGYTANPTRFVYSRHTVEASTDLKTQLDKAADTLISDKTFTLTGTGAKNSEITITYYYKIASGSITQHYVDTDGNTLANDTTTGQRVAKTDIVDIKRPDQLTKDGYKTPKFAI